MTAELDEIAHDLSGATVGEGLRLAAEAGFDAEPVSTCAAGALWKSLLDIADEHDAAAITLGSRGLTGLSRALGSVSHAVVHHSRRPVFVVSEPSPR